MSCQAAQQGSLGPGEIGARLPNAHAEEAQQLGIDDICKLFGPKYDEHLKQLPPYKGPQ